MPRIFVTAEGYLVEKVVQHRWKGKRLYFEVKWAGYDDTTWEPHCLLYNNSFYHKYRQTVPEEERDRMVPPKGVRIGDDEDGLCVRRAVEKLELSFVDASRFTPWMTVPALLRELRAQGCYVRPLAKGETTRGRRLILIRGSHAMGYRSRTKKGNKNRRKKKMMEYRNPHGRHHLVFLVAKRRDNVTSARDAAPSGVVRPS